MPARLQQLFTRVLSTRSLMETIGNATALVVARFGGAVANFVFTLLLAQQLAPSQVGFVMTAMSLAVIASLVTTLNMENGAVRHLLHPLERGNREEAAGFISYGRKILFRLSPFVIGLFLLFMLANQSLKNELTRAEIWGLIFVALTIPLLSALRLGSSWGHALSKIIKSMLSGSLFRPVLLCVLTGAMVIAGMSFSVDRILLVTLFACGGAFIVQYFLLRDTFTFAHEVTPDTSRSREWMRTGLYLSVTILLIDYFQNVVVVTSALGLEDDDVARLAIALRFSGFLRIGLMAVNMAVSPRVSKAINAENREEARSLLSHSTHLKFWPTIGVTAGVWWLSPWLVGLFGEEYVSAAWALRLFALLPLFAAFFGPSIMILNISGRQQQIFRVSAVSLALLVIAVPVAGLTFGLQGSVIAAVLTIFFWEWALYDRTRRETGFDASILGALQLRAQSMMQEEQVRP